MAFRAPNPRGAPLTIYDEGIPLSNNVESIDAVGAGVIASGGKDIEFNIPGGGGSGGSDIVSVINIDDTDSPYAPASSNILILADTTNGNISIDIANAVGLTDGYTFYVKKTNASNTITFTANVDGGTKTLYSTMMVKLYYTNSLFYAIS